MDKWLRKHYILNSLINLTPVFGATFFITIFGDELNMVSNDGLLTLSGKLFAIILITITFLYFIITKRTEYKNDKEADEAKKIFRDTLSSINSLTSKKNKIYKTTISEIKSGRKDFDLLLHKEHINDILYEILGMVSNYSQITKHDINISLIVKFPTEENWSCYSSINIEDTLTLDKLFSDSKSTLYQLLTSQVKEVFYNDKNVAIIEGKYIPDFKDQAYNNLGSIICRRIQLSFQDIVFLEGILSISTYGKRIQEKSTKSSTDEIFKEILFPFELKIQESLSDILFLGNIIDILNQKKKTDADE